MSEGSEASKQSKQARDFKITRDEKDTVVGFDKVEPGKTDESGKGEEPKSLLVSLAEKGLVEDTEGRKTALELTKEEVAKLSSFEKVVYEDEMAEIRRERAEQLAKKEGQEPSEDLTVKAYSSNSEDTKPKNTTPPRVENKPAAVFKSPAKTVVLPGRYRKN